MDEADDFWEKNSPFVLKEATDLFNGGASTYAEDTAYALRCCSFCHRTRRQRHLETVVIRERQPVLAKRSKQTKAEDLEEAMRGQRRQVFYRCRAGACRAQQRRLGYRDDP